MLSMSTVEQKRRGRPPGSAFADPMPMRLTVEQLAAVDAWRRAQADPPSRSEALRHIVGDWLARQGYLPREEPEDASQ